jgi:hypothetical protein
MAIRHSHEIYIHMYVYPFITKGRESHTYPLQRRGELGSECSLALFMGGEDCDLELSREGGESCGVVE